MRAARSFVATQGAVRPSALNWVIRKVCPGGARLEVGNFICDLEIKKSMNQVITALATLVAITTILTVPAYADIPEEVHVGSVLPLTGGYSSVGVQVDDATKLAIDDFNLYLEEMGAGWQFVLSAENSESNPVAALERVTTLKSKGADIIFGPAGSGRVNSVLGYANENNMLILSCCSTAPALAIADDAVYRIVADDTNQGKAIGKLLEASGAEVVVPVWIGDTYGDGLKAEIVSDFEARGGMSDEGVRYNPDTAEFSVTVGTLADTVQGYVDQHGEDKVAIAIVAFDEIVSILQAATSYPVLESIRWFGSETIADSTSLQQDRIAREFATDIGFTAVQVDVDTGDKAAHVREALKDTHGDSPNVFVYTGYDAVWLVGLSIIEADSANVDDIKAVLHDVADQYTTGALRSTSLNEAGDLATGNYGIRTMDDGVWIKGDIYYSEIDTISSTAGDSIMDEPETSGPSVIGELSDGTVVEVRATEPAAGESMAISVSFVDSEHVNYDIVVMQGDTEVLNQEGAHFHGSTGDHHTSPLESGDPVDIDITFQGFGVDTITGPVGDHVAFAQVVPEFGTIAALILAVAIVSIVAVSAKSRLSIIPRY